MPLRHALLAVAVAATWGLNFVVIDVGLEQVTPLVLCALRFALVGVPLAFFVRRPAVPWRLIVGIGVALGIVKFGLLFMSMDVGMPAGLASVVLQAQAPFTLLLAALVAGERPTGAQSAGLLVALLGIGLIASASGGGGMTAAGLAMCLAAAAAWAVANLLMKRATAADPIALMVWISLIPPLPLLMLSLLIDGPSSVETILHLNAKSLLAVLYIAAFSTLGAFGAWSFLMKTHPAAQVASFALLVPPFGLTFAALLLNEPLGPLQIASALLVVSGVALSTTTVHPLTKLSPAR
ncbi:EamA family transporter [Conexibacter woesei]|uniref:EamA family transporter n=1 Tax=Conexibacter woesei TaxID=191495 RepID=UPI0003F58DC9|nr:EamA family transporter [Conexibacter woesei]